MLYHQCAVAMQRPLLRNRFAQCNFENGAIYEPGHYFSQIEIYTVYRLIIKLLTMDNPKYGPAGQSTIKTALSIVNYAVKCRQSTHYSNLKTEDAK